MRGGDERSGSLFSYVDLEARVGKDHPLRAIREIVNEALAALSGEFSALYSRMGRPSIPPEKLLRAMLLQAFYSIRSERQLMERLEFDLLFRWFVGLGVDDAVWDHSTFSKNRDRLLEGEVAAKLLGAVLAQPRVKRLLSHGSLLGRRHADRGLGVDEELQAEGRLGTSRRPPGGGRNGEVDFHGQKRSNETHASTTDPEARLYRKGPGKEAKLCFMGHALMENRNGLVVDACLTEADGHAERIAALHMIEPRADRPRPITLGADKAYDAEDFVNELRSMNVTPHVAQNTNGRSLGHRRAHDAPRRLRGQPAHPQAHRGGLRLDQDRRRPGARPSSAAASASDGPSPSRPPPTIWSGCRSSWRPRHEGPGQLPTDRPLADRRGRHLGSRSPRSLRPGDADDHRARRRNRLRRPGGRPRSRIRPRLDRLPLGRMRRRRRSRGRRNRRTPRRRHDRDRVRLHNGDEAVLKAKRDTSSTAC